MFIRSRLLLFPWIALLLLLPLQLKAKASPPVDETIPIDITVQSSRDTIAQAKKQSMQDGEKQALYQAMNTLAPGKARSLYKSLRGKDITRFVRSYTVTREVVRSGYYEADVTFRFDKSMLHRLTGTKDKDTPQEGAAGDALLIVPPYDTGGDMLLFDRANLWRAILNNVALEIGQGALVMPFGDPRDEAALTDESIIAPDVQEMARLASRYGTRNVVIAYARSRMFENKPIVEVILRKPGGKKEDERVLQYKARSEDETLDLMLARAARDVSLRLRDDIEHYTLFGDNEQNRIKGLVLRLEYQHGREWRNMRRMLDTMPGLVKLSVGAISTDYAQVTLMYRGTPELIKKALLAQGFTVNTEHDYWLLSHPHS